MTVAFNVKPEQVSRMRIFVQDLTIASRAEDGCIMYLFLESHEQRNRIFLNMSWRDEEAFNRYSETPLVRAFDSGIANELLKEPYTIETWKSLG